jgi:spore cortex formation protein SpoVR/YcgB (stage V sporulation)
MLGDLEEDRSKYVVAAIHNEQGYRRVRQTLAAQYRMEAHTPPLSVVRYAADSDRALLLQHRVERGRLLDADSAATVLQHLHELWQFDVVLEEVDDSGTRLKIHRT